MLAKLHFAGHYVSQESLEAIWTILSTLENSTQHRTLDQIVYKLNELTIMQSKRVDDTLVKECLISLNYKSGKMSYLDIMNEKFKKSILYISPYEYCTNTSTHCLTECSVQSHLPTSSSSSRSRRRRATQ